MDIMQYKDPEILADDLFKSKFLRDVAQIAIEAHRGQTRADKATPYSVHSIRVGYRVYRAKWSQNLSKVSRIQCVITGFCHDFFEDTTLGPKEIREQFGQLGISEWSASHILPLIEALTQDKSLPWKERRQKMLDHCGEMPIGAKVVKLADRLDNMSEMGNMSIEFRQRYCKESRIMLKNMAGTCPDLEHQLVEVVTRQEMALGK